jgi:hypothetical protein
LRTGQEIDGINCDLADFLSQMDVNPEAPAIVCVNAGESMKKHEHHIGGKLWLQGDRQMTATNVILPGMANEEKSATIVAVAEAIEWKHAFEPAGLKRQGQRVVIYPPFLDKLDQALATGDSSCDPKPSHGIAYQRIFAACQSFESPLRLYSSDSPDLVASDVVDKVPLWMNTAKEISIGGRRQDLEDEADVCNSESDSKNEEHGEELTGCYVGPPVDEHGNQLSASYKLSEQQAAALRWESQQSKGFAVSTIQDSAAGTQMPTIRSLPLREEKLTPLNSDDEQVPRTEQKSAQASAWRKAQKADTRGLPSPHNSRGPGSSPKQFRE